MSQGEFTPPQPTAEHAKLMEHAGIWKVDSSFYMDPSQPPMQVEATEKIEAFGGFWTVSLYECEMFGTPFQGKATLGYDPNKKEYVSTWIDSMSPNFFHFTGQFKGDVLDMKGSGFDCQSGQMANYRTTEEHINPDHRVFSMYVVAPDGNETKMMTHVYKRAR